MEKSSGVCPSILSFSSGICPPLRQTPYSDLLSLDNATEEIISCSNATSWWHQYKEELNALCEQLHASPSLDDRSGENWMIRTKYVMSTPKPWKMLYVLSMWQVEGWWETNMKTTNFNNYLKLFRRSHIGFHFLFRWFVLDKFSSSHQLIPNGNYGWSTSISDRFHSTCNNWMSSIRSPWECKVCQWWTAQLHYIQWDAHPTAKGTLSSWKYEPRDTHSQSSIRSNDFSRKNWFKLVTFLMHDCQKRFWKLLAFNDRVINKYYSDCRLSEVCATLSQARYWLRSLHIFLLMSV